jgi:hypothetical protein
LAKTILHGEERPRVPVFYRIRAVRITGHRATVEPPDKALLTAAGKGGWQQRILRLVRGKLKQSSF